MGGAVRGLMLVLGLPIPCDSRGGYGFQQVEQCVGDHRHPVADHHKRTADGGADQVDRRIAAVVHAHHLRQLGVWYQPAQHRVGCAAKQPGSRAQHQSENDQCGVAKRRQSQHGRAAGEHHESDHAKDDHKFLTIVPILQIPARQTKHRGARGHDRIE